MDDELYHYGILGMKWGVRRYENYDGTLTSAGKKRYSEKHAESDDSSSSSSTAKASTGKKIVGGLAIAGASVLAAVGAKKYSDISETSTTRTVDSEMRKRAMEPVIKGGKDKPPMSRSENSVKQLSNATGSFRSAIRAIANIKHVMNTNADDIDVSKMTDEELKTKSNRMRLERNYLDLVNNPIETKGQMIADDLLTVTESMANITIAGLIGYRMIQEIRGK